MSRISSLSKRIQDIRTSYIGEYDETEDFIYTNDRYLIPNFMRRLIGMKQIRPDRRVRRYGRIKAHLFYYITSPMIIITSLLLYVVVTNFMTLLVFFETNIALNGVIVSLMIFGILRVYYNSFLIFRASAFLKDVERVSAKDEITARDVENLRVALEGKGELFNTYSMSEVLDNIEKYGFFNITDNQARFIKSKLGYRVNSNRKGVNFISGILVMLGLLGTFLGLLATIDAVGDALNGMANIGGDSGEVGAAEMAAFIGSLSAPLQGMGLAFSSSLFGLSGSLLIGFFLHLASTPQNYFIENVSRWIDDRIKRFDPKKLAEEARKQGQGEPPKASAPKTHASDKDLKDWLTGYVFLTTETNKQLSDLSQTISNMGIGLNDASQELRTISSNQNAMVQSSHGVENSLQALLDNAKQMSVSMKDVQDLSHMINSAMTSVDLSNKAIADRLPELKETLQSMNDNSHAYSDAMYGELKALNQNSAEANMSLVKGVPALESSMDKMSDQSIKIARHNASEIKQTQKLLTQIEGVLEKIERSSQHIANNQGTENRLLKIEKALHQIDQSNKDITSTLKQASQGRGKRVFSFLASKPSDTVASDDVEKKRGE